MEAELHIHELTVPRALLIDLDNCPKEIGRLRELLTRYDRVIVAYGGVSPKVPLSLVPLLAQAIAEGALDLIGLPKRKNAADFALAFSAGRLAEQLPADTHFDILSDDGDLDSVIELLASQGLIAQRIGNSQRQPTHRVDYTHVAKQYYEGRLLCGLASPVRRATLRKSIRSFFKHMPEIVPDHVIRQLVSWRIVFIDDEGRTTYDLSRESDAPVEKESGCQ